MNKMQQQVAEFHAATGATVGEFPYFRDSDLRIDLIDEESDEFKTAIMAGDLVAAADALGDLLYVVFGAGVTFGIDLEPIFDEIHRSNMTKVGGPVREDGKRLKPDTYEPPNLAPILFAQAQQAAR